MASPILNVRLVGEEQVTVLNESITWTPKEKVEITFVIAASDGAKTVTYTNVEKPRLIVFNGNGNYTVSVTSSANTIAFETRDIYIFSPTTAFMSTITSITVSTTSTSDVTIEAKIYGEI